ncbi:MAG: hypothetical protein ACFE0R_17835 [Salinarimonas sp.]
MRGVLPAIGIAAALAVSAPSGAAFGQEPGLVPGADVWTYNPRALSAYVSPAHGLSLTIACDVDALRIYLFSDAARGPGGAEGVVTARFAVGEATSDVVLRRDGRYFSGVERISEASPLVAALAGEGSVSVVVGDTDAGTFPLDGAGAALRGLVADCG